MSQYVNAGNFNTGPVHAVRPPFRSVTVLGNTTEATMVYANVDAGDAQTARKEMLAGRIAGFLGLMGLSTETDWSRQ